MLDPHSRIGNILQLLAIDREHLGHLELAAAHGGVELLRALDLSLQLGQARAAPSGRERLGLEQLRLVDLGVRELRRTGKVVAQEEVLEPLSAASFLFDPGRQISLLVLPRLLLGLYQRLLLRRDGPLRRLRKVHRLQMVAEPLQTRVLLPLVAYLVAGGQPAVARLHFRRCLIKRLLRRGTDDDRRLVYLGLRHLLAGLRASHVLLDQDRRPLLREILRVRESVLRHLKGK